MTASSNVWKKHVRTTAISAALITTGFLAACGGGGGGGGGTVTPTPTGSNITPTNVVQRATDALGMLDFFPQVTDILNLVTGTLPGLVNSVASSLGNEICLGGSGDVTLTWSDADLSGTYSVGDTLTLAFTGCQFDALNDTTTGSVTLTLQSPIANPIVAPLAVTLDADVDVTTTGVSGTETVAASFQVTIEATALTELTFTYSSNADTDKVSVASSGVVTGQLGCFSVAHTVSLLGGVLGGLLDDAATLAAQGLTVNSTGEVTMVDGTTAGTLALTLDAGTAGPTAGIVNLLSDPTAYLPCPALSLDVGSVTSDGSYATLTADGDGTDAVLQVYDAADNAVGTEVTIDWAGVF